MAAVLGAGDDEREVQREDTFVLEKAGNAAIDDALCEALDYRGLADARFADQYGIVLRTAAKDLDDPLEFGFAADKRVEPALGGLDREVAGKFMEPRRL